MKDYNHNIGDYSGVDYEVKFDIKGGDASLESKILENSKLELLKAKPPISSNALRYRVQEDIINIKKTLKNQGYFEADINADVEIKQDPKTVKLTLNTGPRYNLGGMRIEVDDHDREVHLTPSKLSNVVEIDIGEPVDQERLFEANIRLVRYFKNHGYPFAKMEVPEGQLNKDKKSLFVIFKVKLDTKRKYGQVTIKGDKNISRQYVTNRIVWQKGEDFDERDVERTKRKLINTEIFSSVDITPVKEEGDKTCLLIDLVEGKPRSIGVGAQYTSSEGMGGKILWQHRNLWGEGEVLSAEVKGNKKESKGVIIYKTPDVLMADLDLIARLQSAYKNTNAYKGQIHEIFLDLEYWWQDTIRTTLGIDYEKTKLMKTVTQREWYFSLPASLLIDARNDAINPYKGWRFLFEVAPYFRSFSNSQKMLRLLINGNYYLRLIKKDKLVIGVWGRIGKISNVASDEIPYDKRFYSGGLNSVRGYGYQKLGPIDATRNPIGGKTLVEFGVEPRIKITDKIGAVVFAEAGSVDQGGRLIARSRNYLIGYGVGARYYTEIGPIRLDLAFPSKKRAFQGKRYDAPFQLYVSIGQAF